MSSIDGIRDTRTIARQQTLPNLFLALRCATMAVFFAARGMVWSQNSSVAEDSYSSATVAMFFSLGLLAIPRLFDLRSLRWPPFGFYLGLLVVWFGIACLITFESEPVYEPRNLVVEFAGAVVLTVLIYINFQTIRELQGLMVSIVGAGIVSSLMGVEYYFTTGGNGLRFGALGDTGATYNTVSYMLAAAAMAGPVAASMVKRNKQTLAMPYRFAMFGLLVFAILLTGTRGGVLAVGLAVITGNVVLNRSQFKKTFQTALAATVFLACAVALSQTDVVNRIFFDTKGFHSLAAYAQNARGEMFLHALGKVFSDARSPWLGIGVGQYRFQSYNGIGDYPHNLFLDLAVNAGIPAALCKGMLLWHMLSSLAQMSRDLRLPQQRYLAFQILGVAVVSIVGGLICFQFTANLQLWVIMGAWGSLEMRRRDTNTIQLQRRAMPARKRLARGMPISQLPQLLGKSHD